MDFKIYKNLSEIIDNYPDKPWNWKAMSKNYDVTMELIDKYHDKPWDWNEFAYNDNITFEIIKKYPDKNWNWKGLSVDDNLTIDFIDKYPDKDWDWREISRNSFQTDYENTLKELKFKYIEEELMQKAWHPDRFMDWCLCEYEK